MNFTAADVKRLRDETGAGFNDCKTALNDASSFEEAKKAIEKKGQQRAEKLKGQERETMQGAIVSYIHHGGNLGVLLELNCSTDFVSRNDDFRNLAKEIAIQVAGMNPKFISFSDIPAEVLDAARKEYESDPELKKKPVNVREKIVDGKLKKHFGSDVLMEQSWVKDESKTIGGMINEMISKTGENIVVRRFVRFVLGE